MKWFLIVLTVLTLSKSYAIEELPLPLPDDPPSSTQPEPTPYPTPTPEPAPTPAPKPSPKPEPSGPANNYSLGVGDTGRFKEREFTFYPRKDWNLVTYVRLSGLQNNIKIKSAYILYADQLTSGYESNLVGELKAGGILQTWLQGRPIVSITVVAQNKHFWKKPGSFRVDVTGYH